MDKVAHFYKEPFPNFKKHFEELISFPTGISSKTKWSELEIKEIYDKIELPTKIEDSNIYVFSFPMDITLTPIDVKVFPLGICCEIIEQDYIFITKRYVSNVQSIKPIDVNIFSGTEILRFGQENQEIILRLENKSQSKIVIEKNTPLAIGLFLKTGMAF